PLRIPSRQDTKTPRRYGSPAQHSASWCSWCRSGLLAVMKCPFCHDLENKVIDSRVTKDDGAIRRRRECLKCERRFTTYERVEEMLPLIVKKDGRREPYDRVKIVAGLKKACEKRPVSVTAIEHAADRVERQIQERGEKEIVSS